MNDMNCVFYSKNNIVLGKRLKENISKFGFELIYSNDLAEITDFVYQENKTLIFVDKRYKNYAKLIYGITKSKLFKNVLVVYVDDEETYYNDFMDSNNFFVIPENNLEDNLGDVLRCCRMYLIGKVNINMLLVSDIVSGYLSQLGFSPKHAGYRYIKQCVEYAIQNSFNIGKSLYKDTYLFVARKNNGSIASIERNIRNAISQARRNTGFVADGFEGLRDTKVTNRFFLSYIVDKLSTSDKIYVKENTNVG